MARLKFSLAIILFHLVVVPIVVRAADAPTIKTVMPKQVAAGGGELRVRLTGKMLKKDSQVLVNNVALPPEKVRFQQGDLLALIPADQVAQPGTVSISVKSKDGTLSNVASLAVIVQGDLTITAIQPRVVVAGATTQAFGVIVQGENFDKKAIVRVGGFKTTTEVRRAGDFSIVIGTVDPAEVAFAGSVPVQIENGDGMISNTFSILISPPPPRLDQTDPTGVTVGSAQTTIKLTGTEFTTASKVLINGQEVPSRLRGKKKSSNDPFRTAKAIEADVPADFFTQIGQLTVQVVTEGVGDSDVLLLNVKPPKDPIIYSINPSSVPAGSKDFDLVIMGDNFKDAKNVLVNGAKTDFNQITKAFLSITIKEKSVANSGQVSIQVVGKDNNSNTLMLRVEQPAVITTIAGDVPGFQDGIGKKAFFANPGHATLAPNGMVYIADQANNAIRRLNPATDEVVTIAGNPDGRPGFVDTVDIDKDRPTVRFNNPVGIVSDQNGTLFITDFGNHVVRRLRFGTDGKVVVDTVAGRTRVVKNDDGSMERVGLMGFLDDVADRATFDGLYGIVIDQEGNLIIADSFNNVIRKVTFENGQAKTVTTIFGNGFPGLSDGAGNSVEFNTPTGLFMRNGKLFVSDFNNNTIRQIDMNLGQVAVVAGLRRSLQSSALDQVDRTKRNFSDGTRFFAVLDGPISSTMDDSGNLFFIDFNRNRVRRLSPDGTVTTIAGGNLNSGFTDGPGTKADFRGARHILFMGNKTLLVVDSGNHRIREITLQ